MYKIILISIITFLLVIVIFLIFISFLNIDIKTNSKKIENFNVQEPSFTGGAVLNNVYGSTTEVFIQFNSSGTLTIPNSINCDILIVGGGGGGGSRHAGGGGAGSVIYLTNQNLNSGTYSISIGKGGNGTNSGIGENGNDSIISLNNNNIYLAKGGGGGGYGSGRNGGSGGGCSWGQNIGTAINNNIPAGIYGNNGGSGTGGGEEKTWGGGGGGGASFSGSNAILNGNVSIAGNGGNGKQISITGLNIYYGGGGGGGVSWNGINEGAGGLGGGGAGSKGTATALSGIENSGGGGGGAGFQGGNNGRSGNGGSGVIIFRFKSSINKNYISELFENKKPWGMYFADDFDGYYLKDKSENKRDAYTSGNINKISKSGNGASANITYLSGGTNTRINWPNGSIPANFTILSLTRYTGGSRHRILSSDTNGGNFLHGHWGYDYNRNSYRGRGCVHYDGWKSSYSSPILGNLDDWLCCIGKNGGTNPNNILFDGVPSGTSTGGIGGYKLSINNNPWGENSDWALSCLIIWDKHLEDNEMQLLNSMINTYKSNGKPLIDIINNNTNSSFTTEPVSSSITLSIDEKYNKNNEAFNYIPQFNSELSINENVEYINKNNNKYTYSSSDKLTIFDTNRYINGTFFKSNDGEKITIKFKNSFVLKKIIFVANERNNAPADWTINIGNKTLMGIASSEDYDAIQGRSDNNCVKFYIDNTISSDTYNIVFNRILGGTQLNFNKIILFEGTNPQIKSTSGTSIDPTRRT